jgi:chromate reductase, NAD(P)H dehydrogenase (quinone)
MRVLGISGSLRRDSFNTKLLRAAAELLAAEGADIAIYGHLKELPPYDEDDDGDPAPPAAAELRAAVAAADAVFFATPEYNRSIPGPLKNAVDWLSRPRGTCALGNKPVAVVGASTGMFGAVWAQADLRKALAAAGARVLDAELPLAHAPSRFDEEGRLVDADVEEQLREIVGMVVAEAAPATAAVPVPSRVELAGAA